MPPHMYVDLRMKARDALTVLLEPVLAKALNTHICFPPVVLRTDLWLCTPTDRILMKKFSFHDGHGFATRPSDSKSEGAGPSMIKPSNTKPRITKPRLSKLRCAATSLPRRRSPRPLGSVGNQQRCALPLGAPHAPQALALAHRARPLPERRSCRT